MGDWGVSVAVGPARLMREDDEGMSLCDMWKCCYEL